MPERSLEEPGSASQTARSGSGGILALVLLFIINLVNQIDRRGLVVIFPLLQLEWGLTDTQLGLAVSLFTITRALAALPAGWLADKVGALRILQPLALIWSLLAALSGWAGSFFGFIGIRTAVGLADGANGPLDLAYLGRVSPPKRRGLYFSIYSVAVYAGSALGVVFAGVVADRFGWRPVFYIPAGVGLLAALGLFFLPARTEEKAEQKAISEVRREHSAIRSLLHKPLFAIYMGGACGVFASTGLVSWLPSYLMRQFELGLKQAGFLTGGLILPASILGAVLGGWISDRLVKEHPAARRWVAVAGLSLAMLFGLAGLLFTTLNASLAFFFLSSFCFTIPVSPLLVLVQESLDQNRQASGQALFGLVTQIIGAAPATVVVGWLSDQFGLHLALVLPFVMAGVGALVIALKSGESSESG